MKIVSHIIPLATPNILAFRTWQFHNTEDEIIIQIASLDFIQYNDEYQATGRDIDDFTCDRNFKFIKISSFPIDETGNYDKYFNKKDFYLLGKQGDTISRYDQRLLALDYGWEKSKTVPGFSELESALMKKGLRIDTGHMPERLVIKLSFHKEDDCFAFRSEYENLLNKKESIIGFKSYELFDDICDGDGKIRKDYQFDNDLQAALIIERLNQIADSIPVPEMVVDLGYCVYEVADKVPGFDVWKIIKHLNEYQTDYKLTILPEKAIKDTLYQEEDTE